MEQTLKQIKQVRDTIKALQEQEADLWAELGELAPDDYLIDEHHYLNVRENWRFDAATAKKNLTPEQFESILVPKPDSTQAKRVLTGIDYETKTRKLVGVVRTFEQIGD